MFSPTVSCAVDVLTAGSRGSKASYWSTSACVARRSASRSCSVHQSLQVAVAVVLRALVVEAVADLVADHRADRAVVDGVVGLEVEERRLQDGGGEDDLVRSPGCSRR